MIHGIVAKLVLNSGALKYFAWTVTDFLLPLTEYTKAWVIFDILMTITLGLNMINRQMATFFAPTLRVMSVGIFYFCISRASKFNPMKSSSLH